ncbi:unnamed protein product [Caenorhabditis brenneri]
MANTEDNVLPILVQYAADKVQNSEVFLRLLNVCVEFNGGKIHYVLEASVPEQLRHPQAKFDENERLLEFSGELQLGEPKVRN